MKVAGITPKVSVAVVILLAAYITWATVNKTAHHHQGRSSASLRRLQSNKRPRKNNKGNGRRKKKQNRENKREKKTITQKNGSSDGRSGGDNNNGSSEGSSSSIGGISSEAVVSEHDKWKTNGSGRSGLTLQVLNNLDADSVWNQYIEISVKEWDNAAAVTLNLRTVTYNSDCGAVPWAMKVCNDDFGETGWKGLNQVFLQGEYIVASLAKMNDYYLRVMDEEDRLYTMCHELGHGLGLSHSDENFENKDLGDCMDYTHNHENNMHPGSSNFKALKQLYGRVKGYGGRSLRVEKLEATGDRHVNEPEEKLLHEEFDKYAAYLSDPIEVLSNDDSQHPDSKGKWRLLRKTDTAESHERQLGNGYSIRTSILLA